MTSQPSGMGLYLTEKEIDSSALCCVIDWHVNYMLYNKHNWTRTRTDIDGPQDKFHQTYRHTGADTMVLNMGHIANISLLKIFIVTHTSKYFNAEQHKN